MPAGSGEAATKGAGLRDLGVLFDRHLLAGASIPMLSYTGSFALYTFVSPILLQVTNVRVGTAGLCLARLRSWRGSRQCAGRPYDRQQGMDRGSVILLVGIVLSLLLIAFAFNQPAAMIGLVALLGFTVWRDPAAPVAHQMLAECHRPQAMWMWLRA